MTRVNRLVKLMNECTVEGSSRIALSERRSNGALCVICAKKCDATPTTPFRGRFSEGTSSKYDTRIYLKSGAGFTHLAIHLSCKRKRWRFEFCRNNIRLV